MGLPRLESVETPALVIDHGVLVQNVSDMAERARRAGVSLWPHAKTHKSGRVAALQREHGAAGLTVATVREAEYFAGVGFDDILLAYPPVGAWRLERLLELAKRIRLRVVLDSTEAVELLAESGRRVGIAVDYLWEVDCGVRRTGTAPGRETARLLASAPKRTDARLAGLMTFAGHVYGAASTDEIAQIAAAEGEAVRETAAALAGVGIEVEALSVGTTPTSHFLERAGGVSEARPGNYVFYDATQVLLGIVCRERCALSVLATVVSRPDERRLILDAGSKALAAERLSPRTTGFGFVVGQEGLVVERLFEEHAIVTSEEPIRIPIGARVRVVPNHACAAVNLHDRMLIVDQGDEVVDIWPIEPRGWRRAAAP